MPAGGLVIAGVGTAIGVGQALYGNAQRKKYQRQLDALAAQRPEYEINPEEADIMNLAQSRASMGMGAGARQQMQNNTDRTLATLANASLMGGGDANALAAIAERSQNAYNQGAIYNDQVRLQNLSNLQAAYARQSANRDKAWTINDMQPWKDKMTAVSQQLQGANNMMYGGINQAGSGLMSGLGYLGSFGGGGSGTSYRAPMAISQQPTSGPSQFGASASPYIPGQVSVPSFSPNTMGGEFASDEGLQFLEANRNPYANAWM